MKIVAISDTHMAHVGNKIKIPKGDILIHSGDATFRGDADEVSSFCNWFKRLPHKYKIFVAGNHDWLFERCPSLAREMLGPDVIYLEDSMVEIEGLKIWGSPVQPWFCDWAFNKNRGEHIKRHWDLIPEGIDILVTHGPPFGILDELLDTHEKVGCVDLLNAVNRVKPKVHIFGHIHPGYGVLEHSNTKFVNAAIMNDYYEPVNKPIVFDL